MTLAARSKFISPQDYLREEAAALERHEYHAGEVLAMSGGTYRHSRINANFTIDVGQRLRQSPCFMLESNMRLRLAQSDKYVYPDGMIVCGEPAFDPLDTRLTTLTNPKVIIEVLSESTEAYDRGNKFSAYRDLPTMEEYVLVSQSVPMIETFHRQADGGWLFAAWQGLEAVARLASVGISVPLAEVYRGLPFKTPAETVE